MTAIGERVTLLGLSRDGSGCESWRDTIGEWQYRRGWPFLALRGESDVSQGRGALASQWLSRHRTEWSLWLDDDIEIEWGALREFVRDAMASDHSYVCAQYVGKAPRSGVLTARLEGPAGMLRAGGYHRVIGSGFGCVMVRRSVFERMDHMLPLVRWARTDCLGRPYFLGIVVPTKEDPEGPRIQLGEDYAFGFRARAIGVELYCDTRVRAWHRGNYRYGLEDADSALTRFDTILVRDTQSNRAPGSCSYPPELADELSAEMRKAAMQKTARFLAMTEQETADEVSAVLASARSVP